MIPRAALSRQSRFYVVPVDQVLKIHNLRKVQQRLEQKLQRDPYKAEIAHEARVSVDEVHKIIGFDRQKVSLDGPVHGAMDSGPAKNFIPHLGSKSPDKKVSSESTYTAIMGVVYTLGEREKMIVSDYYGLSGNEPLTLSEIGKNLNITRERVRQIKDKAIKSLNNDSFRNLLQDAIAANPRPFIQFRVT